MFFLIAGVSPKTILLEQTPRICPFCGLAQARLSRVDHYLNLFFIPVLRVRKGQPQVVCNRCQAVSDPDSRRPVARQPSTIPICRHCSRSVAGDFRYCPYCGQHLGPASDRTRA